MVKRFALVWLFAVAILIMAGAHALTAQAQPASPVAAWKAFDWTLYNRDVYFAILENGDVYFRDRLSFPSGPPSYCGNFWEGIPAPSSPIQHWEFWRTTDVHAFVAVFLENGDVYGDLSDLVNNGALIGDADMRYLGNFWTGAVSTSAETWGKIKNTYRGND